MPASRRASSKLASRSLCFPTPFVRKIFFGTSVGILFLILNANYILPRFLELCRLDKSWFFKRMWMVCSV